MSDYKAPTNDMMFVLEHIANLSELASREGYEHADLETVDGVLGEAARFMEEQLVPLNQKGDQEGVVVKNGQIFHPDGFADAYERFVEAGWNGIALDESYGGGGMPWCVGLAVQEMMTAANMAFSLCPLLTQGAIDAISHHASETLQEIYLPKMISGEWSGTMNLTEPQAGSDVGALTSKALPGEDGTWLISGTKIFITYGEHELSENIIHLVLARTPDAPPGTKGISLFLVPKYLVNDDGSLGERNDLRVVSSEHKIGIHASPTCVMSYGDEAGAVGWMVGEENTGMGAMFTMMNNARLSVGLQGLSLTDRSYQQARQYSVDRKQGKAIGAELEAGESSPIADHADVRRMLMTMRANAEAMRCVMYANAAAIDFANSSRDGTEREYWDAVTALLTPISKGWGTDLGVEMTSLGVQTHGGMGYVEETGIAQHWRDVRIAPIYEGTNGIQAADLVFRKLPLAGGQVFEKFVSEIGGLAEQLIEDDRHSSMGQALLTGKEQLSEAGVWLGSRLAGQPNDAAAGSVPFMRLTGVIVGGYYLARSAQIAQQLLDSGEGDVDFLSDKIAVAKYYAEQILPTVAGLVPTITQGAQQFYAIPNDRL
ncbi:MAG: acyl-CoA dehydrogenase [marine actinobacterium MedAcidi-G3]|nr:MAG: acyl-CoA dehydrogenase [marine actinobacterium MedAcidi-G3]MBA4813575.1 acyl-CoA dehydrogenase [Acidimicrobiales bacterium]OUW87349.1 MAG: acyl-CoA dehydrogenase [Acidimicrobiaceae bacterium TMED224]HCJ86270.1 acyl-CoA dehydrogenase [Acidimicrobiaceae bacterium]|tara:strand:+ start:683 stop:2479 length:1797 start_codon:yes stop_codon:yes gene_type:complete